MRKREEKLRRKQLIDEVYSKRILKVGEKINKNKNGIGRVIERRYSTSGEVVAAYNRGQLSNSEARRLLDELSA